MFLQSRPRQDQLKALLLQLADQESAARYRRQWDEAADFALARRRALRELLLEQEFHPSPIEQLAYP